MTSDSKMGWAEDTGPGEEPCLDPGGSQGSQALCQLAAGRSGLRGSHTLPGGGKWEVSPALRSAMED